MEVFKTQREFNNKFPSKMYICPKCSMLTFDKYLCKNCKNQSNNFVFRGYTYTILKTGVTETIFIPIEYLSLNGNQDK
ncbi:MAG: hypothetical protein SPL73_05635 [Cyanobacteriota bacterium]|nr:hypothetical protein [Cyanobacteriota bacterium]MDY6364353.1 hypothetical protein [Cyanobacteriota bacterium]